MHADSIEFTYQIHEILLSTMKGKLYEWCMCRKERAHSTMDQNSMHENTIIVTILNSTFASVHMLHSLYSFVRPYAAATVLHMLKYSKK